MTRSPVQIFEMLSRTSTPVRHTRLLDTAVVLGGSIAGLLAARVLADHADTVLIVEPDEPNTWLGRGAPHRLQGHALLAGGRAQIERWFPGFTERAVALGAVLCQPEAVASYADGVRQVGSGENVLLSSSRPFLERQIGHHTLALPNVNLITGRAVGLRFEADAVAGVRYVLGDAEHERRADLVVDAMGRASKLSDWLEHVGWQRPNLRRISTGVNYATGYFRRRPGESPITAAIARFSPRYTDSDIAVAGVNAIENDQWMILLAGYGQDRPSRDPEQFAARCKAELPPIFGEATSGECVGEIRTYHQADSRRRDFHATGLPARLVSVGDAVASFNPVYGQGISSAALHASCLAAYLESAPALGEPAAMFFDLQRVVVDAAWQISTAGDAARQPSTDAMPSGERVRRWLGAQISAAAVTDRGIAQRFDAVATMRAHPATLAKPGVVLRAVLANLRQRYVAHRGRRDPCPELAGFMR
jgi:2-polyprenyl-6-methoxyphenol hydroxylase-like FAD-dependent oxidoreductase